MGLTDTSESEWANAFTHTPQIGGGFSQGTLNLDYIAWVESVVTDPAPSLAEAAFTTQWNALRWIEAGPTQQGFYQRNPEAFRYMGRSAIFWNYEVRLPSPVLAATDTPPVLVLGPYENYNILLRSLAITDDGPSRVIPVEGTAYIDDYSLAELEQFPVLFLYAFQAHNPARAAKLLDAYVRAGGGVIADVGGDGQLAAALARDGAPLPVTSWRPVELFRSWAFRKSHSPLTRGIDLSRFSPALYAGTQPYLVEFGQKLAPGSEVALESGSRPLVVTKAAGGGLVVESGINLPYHDAIHSNTTESSLLARMIKMATARRWASGQPAQEAVVLAADSDQLQVGSADGVLFKETDTPDWHATVDGRAAATYPAGPGYMYVRLSSSIRAPATVEFRYQLSTTEWASIVLSVLTGLLLLAYLTGARIPRRLRARLEHAQQRLTRRLLPGTTAIRATREVLQEVLADPSAQNRRRASMILRGKPLRPYADLLLQAVRTEGDPACLSELRSLVVETQWEPQASPAIIELRRWAAGASGEATLGTHVANPDLVHRRTHWSSSGGRRLARRISPWLASRTRTARWTASSPQVSAWTPAGARSWRLSKSSRKRTSHKPLAELSLDPAPVGEVQHQALPHDRGGSCKSSSRAGAGIPAANPMLPECARQPRRLPARRQLDPATLRLVQQHPEVKPVRVKAHNSASSPSIARRHRRQRARIGPIPPIGRPSRSAIRA